MAKKFVVYQLTDPESGKPFYIGSGRRGRPYEHFAPAANGVSGRKNDKIREILAAGGMPKVDILIETDDRDLAYETEKTLIKSTGGLLNETGVPDKPVVVFLDEFIACAIMKPATRAWRMARLVKMFPLDECKKRPGYARLWFAALGDCARTMYGKA